jgi:hypothetical protein
LFRSPDQDPDHGVPGQPDHAAQGHVGEVDEREDGLLVDEGVAAAG